MLYQTKGENKGKGSLGAGTEGGKIFSGLEETGTDMGIYFYGFTGGSDGKKGRG